VINGVDTENLRLLIDRVANHPEEGKFTFRTVTSWDSNAHSTTRIRGFTLESDEPAGLLGGDKAPNAVELILGALGSCLSVGVVYHAALRGIRIRALRFEIEGQLDVRAFLGLSGARPGYQHIQVTVNLDSEAERTDLQDLLEQVIRTSPVADIISHHVPLDISLAK
jgi:uncharacterized OsmC-like protein